MENNATAHPADSAPGWLELVREKVAGLRHGVVQLVHDGRVTQIERTGKPRLPAAAGPRPPE
jgi:hypothetical protein